MKAPIPPGEAERLADLRELGLLEQAKDPQLESLARIAGELCDAPVALLTVIGADRQWIKAGALAEGSVVESTSRDDAFCAHTIVGDDLLVVNDATADARFRDNPFVRGEPHIRFYAGAPLRMPSGRKLGALCVVDYVPRELSQRARAALSALGAHAESLIALRAANQRLDKMQQQKERLIEYIAHDVKNALGTVTLCGEELRTAPLEPPLVREIGADIGAAAQRIDGLVLDLLDAIRAERTGAISVRPVVLAVDEVLESSQRAVFRMANARGISLETRRAGLRVRADRGLLYRVIENLLDNAIRHSPDGTSIVLSSRSEGGDVVLCVSDHGLGVPPAYREAVFELYEHKSDSSRGRGIGLAFCRIATTAMSGRVWVTDGPEGGATFCVALPGT